MWFLDAAQCSRFPDLLMPIDTPRNSCGGNAQAFVHDSANPREQNPKNPWFERKSIPII